MLFLTTYFLMRIFYNDNFILGELLSFQIVIDIHFGLDLKAYMKIDRLVCRCIIILFYKNSYNNEKTTLMCLYMNDFKQKCL